MGYNNNHAGMHMIWFRHYGVYDDLEYYDRYVEKLSIKRKDRLSKEEPSIKEEIKVSETHMNDGKKQLEESTPTTASSDKKKNKRNKNKNETHLWDKHPEYGTEKIIDLNYFAGLPHAVMANIMLMAMRGKKDIYQIFNECETAMKQDFRTNPAPDSNWSWMPKLEPVIIFLSMLADKLDCSVYEFFIDDENRRRRFVYSLIDNFKKDEFLMWDDSEIEENGSATFTIYNFDHEYGMTEEFRNFIIDGMNLELTKNVYDEEIGYAISFGNLIVNRDTGYNYSLKGAYLLEEDEGKLKDYIEELIAAHSRKTDNIEI